MNEAHFHLVVNHLPIIFPIVGIILIITGLISKSDAVKRTAFMIFIMGALAAIAAMATGEGAEEIVEKLNGVSESFIKKHEEMAETFAVLSYVLGGISLLGLWASFKKKTFSWIISIATLALAFVILFFGKQTGTSGGEIRHTEIRSNTSTTDTKNVITGNEVTGKCISERKNILSKSAKMGVPERKVKPIKPFTRLHLTYFCVK